MNSKEILELIESKIHNFGETPNGTKLYVINEFALDEIKQKLTLTDVVKSLPQDNYCQVCKLPTDGEKCFSKRCPV